YYGDKINWDNLLHWAHVTGNEFKIFTLLFLARKIIIADIPEVVMQKMRRSFLVNLFIYICYKIKDEDPIKIFIIREIIMQLANYKKFLKSLPTSVKDLYSVIAAFLYFYNDNMLSILKKVAKISKPITQRLCK
ncbi:MAG: hypothetical protein JSW18_02015, partial [Candidatus Omnitrophota bacterium]